MQRKFSITVRAPIGLRFGSICFETHEQTIAGTLVLLANSNAFTGTISETGAITFIGQIKTKFHTFPYSSRGQLDGHHLELKMSGEHGTLNISGEEIESKECTQ